MTILPSRKFPFAVVPASWQTTGEDRLFYHIDGMVDRAGTRRNELGDASLSDAVKTGHHDEMPGHATRNGVIAATLSRSARRSSRSS